MAATVLVNVSGFNGGVVPGCSIRIDLNNCSNPRVVGTGQLVPLSQTIYPVAGTATITLFDNTQITCGTVNVKSNCGCSVDSTKTSYYSFSFIYQGEVTSIGSYNLKAGNWNLWDLKPCIGSDCVCGGDENAMPIPTEQVPVGVVNGLNRTFTLRQSPSSLWLTVNGLYQTPSTDYTIIDNIITFNYSPSPGDLLNAKYFTGLCIPQFVYAESPSGTIDGVNRIFTFQHAPSNGAALWLYVNGIYQTQGIDYTLSGATVTFVVPPNLGSIISADYSWNNAGGASFNNITTQVPTGTIDGFNTIFTITSIPSFLMLQYNSALLQPGIGFTQTGNTLNLAQAPQPGDVLLATLFN